MFYDPAFLGMAALYPRRFGKYVLLKPMARGGMGEIYLAATGDPGFQKCCVIKKIIPERSDRAKAQRFLDEAKVVLRLSHANLVPTFDAGDIDGEFFIAMDLVEGKDLREIWNRCVRTRTRIPLDVALHIGREVARALSYVHGYGDLHLVHRDVAPPNILLSYFGEVKLTDFGLARSVLKKEQTAPGVVFGRASYLAPEQARGEVADARTDVYSLGIVLWELLTGNQYLQLANVDPATAMSLVRHPRPQTPSAKAPWISPALDTLLLRALAPAREARYQSAEEMRQALADVMAEVAPRADTERVAGFVRGLYETAIKEEREEREALLLAAQALPAPTPAPTPAPAITEPRDTQPDRPAISLEALAEAKVPTAPRQLPPAIPGLPFPREEESLGVDFAGRVIDSRYRVLRKIGEGGMGTVYAAEHVEIGKVVAIKILHPHYSTEQELVERFRREARAASRIGHPNIIDVMDSGTTEDGCAYFIMEYLEGIDLADVLTHERRLDPNRSCQITIQICRALAAAHAAGVIHRDLKPENIFLVARDGKADFVKVLDFGVARSAGRSNRLTNPGIAMGTPEYMAPEQAAGGVVDHRGDIYSVGALLYEMVTGQPPQKRDGEVVGPRSLRLQLSEDLDRIVVRALALDPAQRYQTMSQLEYDLVKSLWGRTRAVADLLGLHQPEPRVEPSPHDIDDQPAQPTLPQEESLGHALLDRLEARRQGTPVAWNVTPARAPVVTPMAATPPPTMTATPGPVTPPPTTPGPVTPPPTTQPASFRQPPGQFRPGSAAARPQFRSPSQGLPSLSDRFGADSVLVPETPIQARSGRGARRFAVTLAVLLAGGAVGVRFWGKLPLPWNTRASVAAPTPNAPPAPTPPSVPPAPTPPAVAGAAPAPAPAPALSPEEQKAQRERAAVAEVDKLLAAGLPQLPELEKRLARWAADEKDPASRSARTHARASLLALAHDDLQKQNFEAATAHYRIGSGLPGSPEEAKALLDLVRTSAIDAIKAGDTDKAVAWAREGLTLAGDATDAVADAHALLADTLYAAKDYAESVAEYKTAIAGKPGDATLKRGLDRARKKVTAEKAPRPRAKARAGKAAASPGEAPADSSSDGDSDKPAPPSAPAEATPDEQQ
ncbi:MAG TPA: protein kinase [Polyangia bacterium]|nr:protein kinase [Polyangia bacterium]